MESGASGCLLPVFVVVLLALPTILCWFFGWGAFAELNASVERLLVEVFLPLMGAAFYLGFLLLVGAILYWFFKK